MADRSKELLDIATKIRTLLCSAVDNITSMVKDLSDEKLVDVSTASIDFAMNWARTCNPIELADKLVAKHAHWEPILNKDMKFYTDDIPIILQELPDVKVLAIPWLTYEQHKDEGFKNYKKGEKKFPIQQKDFDGQWEWFTRIIKGACAYNKKLAKPNPEVTKYNSRLGL